MKTIFVITRDISDVDEQLFECENIAAFSDPEMAKAELISLRNHAETGERFELEEMVLIESAWAAVH